MSVWMMASTVRTRNLLDAPVDIKLWWGVLVLTDALAAEVDLLAIDGDGLVGVAREGVAVAVGHMHAVEVAVVLCRRRHRVAGVSNTVATASALWTDGGTGCTSSGARARQLRTGLDLQSGDIMPPIAEVLAQVLEEPRPPLDRP